jgi:hypothetical protein
MALNEKQHRVFTGGSPISQFSPERDGAPPACTEPIMAKGEFVVGIAMVAWAELLIVVWMAT